MTPRRPIPRRVLSLLAPLVFALPGCLTCKMWENAGDTRGGRVTCAVLTPITVAVDAALFAGYVYAAGQSGGCCHPHRCH
jgi:hypothetical protein